MFVDTTECHEYSSDTMPGRWQTSVIVLHGAWSKWTISCICVEKSVGWGASQNFKEPYATSGAGESYAAKESCEQEIIKKIDCVWSLCGNVCKNQAKHHTTESISVYCSKMWRLVTPWDAAAGGLDVYKLRAGRDTQHCRTGKGEKQCIGVRESDEWNIYNKIMDSGGRHCRPSPTHAVPSNLSSTTLDGFRNQSPSVISKWFLRAWKSG